MEGDLSLLSIPDLLQMICLGGYSRDIHLFDGQTQVGVIAIRNGRVDRCFGYGTWGEAAFFKIVSMRRGRYKVNEAQDMSASDATLTAYSWQELLMEAARQQDEAARAAQLAEASSGRVIPFPTAHVSTAGTMSFDPTGALGAALLRETSPVNPIDFDFGSTLDSGLHSIPGGMSASPPPSPPPAPAAPTRAHSDTGKQAPQPTRVHSDTGKQTPITAAPPAPAPASAPSSPPSSPPSSGAADSTADDVMHLLQEATACYLRRDLARAEALLQKCLELRPGDKRALQNLDRIRRKKPQ